MVMVVVVVMAVVQDRCFDQGFTQSKTSLALEEIIDNDPQYVLAAEKLALELNKKFPEPLQRELANIKENKRESVIEIEAQ